jgi:transcriptional regulator with XRE-family HTH domain
MNRKLKAKIVEHFGTQADFAQAVKIDETVVSRVVRGRRILQAEIQKQWADALQTKTCELFGSN